MTHIFLHSSGSFSLQNSTAPWANHPWQPQLPQAKPLTHLSEAHAKPSEGLQSSTQGLSTSNPFWLHSGGPQPPLFSFHPEPIHKSLFSSSSPATSTCQENIFSNIAAFTAPADTSFTVSIPQRLFVHDALHRRCGSYWLFLFKAARPYVSPKLVSCEIYSIWRKFTQLFSHPFSTSSITMWSKHYCRYH